MMRSTSSRTVEGFARLGVPTVGRHSFPRRRFGEWRPSRKVDLPPRPRRRRRERSSPRACALGEKGRAAGAADAGFGSSRDLYQPESVPGGPARRRPGHFLRGRHPVEPHRESRRGAKPAAPRWISPANFPLRWAALENHTESAHGRGLRCGRSLCRRRAYYRAHRRAESAFPGRQPGGALASPRASLSDWPPLKTFRHAARWCCVTIRRRCDQTCRSASQRPGRW